MSWKVSPTHTLDGVLVTEGLRVWDYNLDPRTVGPRISRYDSDDPWYAMLDDEGRQHSAMNCSRMWARHPSDGRLP